MVGPNTRNNMAILNNRISIQNKIFDTLKKKQYQNFAYIAAQTRFNQAKRDLLNDFDNDPVNQEIKEGYDSNESKYVSRGNLYSFIGFNANVEPIEDLRKFIDENIVLEKQPYFDTKGNRFNYNFPVQYPTLEELYEETSMDKYANNYPNSRSFIELMRNGLNNIGQYIFHRYFNDKYSRSTTGLQNKEAKLGGQFISVPDYIISIFNKFKSKFRKK